MKWNSASRPHVLSCEPEGYCMNNLLFHLFQSLLMVRTPVEVILLLGHMIERPYNLIVLWNFHLTKTHSPLCCSLGTELLFCWPHPLESDNAYFAILFLKSRSPEQVPWPYFVLWQNQPSGRSGLSSPLAQKLPLSCFFTWWCHQCTTSVLKPYTSGVTSALLFCLRTCPLKAGAAFMLEELPVVVVPPLNSCTPAAEAVVGFPSHFLMSFLWPCRWNHRLPHGVHPVPWGWGCLLPAAGTGPCWWSMEHFLSSFSYLFLILDSLSTAEVQGGREEKRLCWCCQSWVTWSTVCSPSCIDNNANELTYSSAVLCTNFCHVDCVLWTSSGSTGDWWLFGPL